MFNYMRRKLLPFSTAFVVAVALAQVCLAAERNVEFTVNGKKVVGTLNLPDGIASPPAILLFHGFTGTRNEEEIPSTKEGVFSRAARLWAEKGIASLRIDFLGNGDSEGKFEDMTLDGQVKEGLAALDFLVKDGEVDKERIAIVGWSMGGAVATGVAARTEQKLTSVSLWAPGVNMPVAIAMLLGPETMKSGLASGDTPLTVKLPWGADVRLKRDFFQSLYQLDPVAEISRFKGPLLVAVGTEDDIVFPQPASGQVLLDYHDGPEELWVRPMGHNFNISKGTETLDELIGKTGEFVMQAFK